MPKTDKPWGYEELLEHNDYYVVKRLFMMKDCCCSLQYHNEKHETIYVLSGVLKIIYGENIDNLKNIILEENKCFAIQPKKIHRMCGVTDCFYLESSTNQLDDVVRLQDDYGRGN